MLRALLITLLIIFAVIIGWHVFFPILGGLIAISAIIWLILLGGIGAFCIAVSLLFILGSGGAIVLGIIFGIWTIIAIALFPVIFPILLPLFIIFLFINYARKRSRNV